MNEYDILPEDFYEEYIVKNADIDRLFISIPNHATGLIDYKYTGEIHAVIRATKRKVDNVFIFFCKWDDEQLNDFLSRAVFVNNEKEAK